MDTIRGTWMWETTMNEEIPALSKRAELEDIFSDTYKDIYGFRPRQDLSHLSDEELEKVIDELQLDLSNLIEYEIEQEEKHKAAMEQQAELDALAPSAEEEEWEKLPMVLGMRKGH